MLISFRARICPAQNITLENNTTIYINPIFMATKELMMVIEVFIP